MAGYWVDGVQSDNARDGVRANLCFTLQLLAARGEDQVAHFPPFVCVADELALDFDHWSRSVRNFWELSDEHAACLASLNDYLDRMSGEANISLWTDEALRNDPHWEQVRHLARVALAAFRQRIELPPPSRYVPGTSG